MTPLKVRLYIQLTLCKRVTTDTNAIATYATDS